MIKPSEANLFNVLFVPFVLVVLSLVIEIYFASTLISIIFITILLLSGAAIMLFDRGGYYKMIIYATVLIMLAPYISVPTLQFAVRPEQIMILGAVTADFIRNFAGYTGSKTIKWILKNYWIFFLIVASTLFSIIYGAIAFKYLPSMGDMMEIAKIMVYFLLFYLASKTSGRKKIIGIIKTMSVCGVIAAIYSVMQYFNIFNINIWLSWVYAPSNHYNVLFKEYVRSYSTFGNPNYFGFYMSLNIILMAVALLFYAKNWKQMVLYSVLYYVYSYGLLTTASRTALISTILGIGYLFIVYFSTKKPFKWSEFTKKCVIFAILGILLFTTMPQTMSFRVDATITPNEINNETLVEHIQGVNSIAGRVERWHYAWNIIKKSPIVGLGPMKERIPSFIDNEYLLLWCKYGIIGLIAYMALYIYIFILGIKGYRRIKGPAKFYGLWLQTAIIIILVDNLMANTFYHMQLMSVIMVISGLANSFFYKRRVCLSKESGGYEGSCIISYVS